MTAGEAMKLSTIRSLPRPPHSALGDQSQGTRGEVRGCLSLLNQALGRPSMAPQSGLVKYTRFPLRPASVCTPPCLPLFKFDHLNDFRALRVGLRVADMDAG
jgi:hypothetical protein